ncbi:MAG TPA: multicopper oxidase family protein [Dongiaceae bacterium]|nr:multicopper oxidase family protein [Dongiaceae bacterium]
MFAARRLGAAMLCALFSVNGYSNDIVGYPLGDAEARAALDAAPSPGTLGVKAFRQPRNFQHPPLARPEKIRADRNTGILSTTLTAGYMEYDFQSFKNNQSFTQRVKLRKYNGQVLGPTLVARPGDTLKIRLVNQLPEEQHPPCYVEDHGSGPHEHCNHNQPHNFNTTNLHTHGLHVDPTGRGDNVFIELTSGESFDYEIKIPADHPAGTFWYHAHVHGGTSVQVGSGMSGALIVKGDYDQIPALAAARKRTLMLQEIAFNASGSIENNDTYAPTAWADQARANGWHISINGQVMPEISLRPGETTLWRFIQAGVRKNVKLALVEPCSNQRVPLLQLAADGIAFDTKRLTRNNDVRLAPGYRSDVLTRIPHKGVYYLVDIEDNSAFTLPPQYCHRNPEHRTFALDGSAQDILARVIVNGERQQDALPANAQLAGLVRPRSISDSELLPTVEYLQFDIDVSKDPWIGLINGRPFDPNYARVLKLNTAQTWELSSVFSHHPYHVHVNPFEVIVRGANGRISDRFWKDTVMIEQLNAQQDNKVEVRTRYADFAGAFVTHCHILDHGDHGMMEKIIIEP